MSSTWFRCRKNYAKSSVIVGVLRRTRMMRRSARTFAMWFCRAATVWSLRTLPVKTRQRSKLSRVFCILFCTRTCTPCSRRGSSFTGLLAREKLFLPRLLWTSYKWRQPWTAKIFAFCFSLRPQRRWRESTSVKRKKTFVSTLRARHRRRQTAKPSCGVVLTGRRRSTRLPKRCRYYLLTKSTRLGPIAPVMRVEWWPTVWTLCFKWWTVSTVIKMLWSWRPRTTPGSWTMLCCGGLIRKWWWVFQQSATLWNCCKFKLLPTLKRLLRFSRRNNSSNSSSSSNSSRRLRLPRPQKAPPTLWPCG